MIKRNCCALCMGELEFIQTFKDFPIYMGVTDKTEKELYQDMEFCSCVKCGCVQLKNLVDPHILYKNPHNPAIGKTWELHNQSFSDYIIFTGAKNIIDIGGANMKIANMVCQSPSIESYTVCDMSAGSNQYETNSKVKISREYIEKLQTDEKYDAAILSHTLEHFYNPVEVLLKIRKILTPDGVIVVSVPNIEQQLRDRFLNAINFEHTYYINDEYIKLMSGLVGMEIVAKKEFSKYNSFYYLKKSNVVENLPNDVSLARIIYKKFVEKIKNDVESINDIILGKSVYCFGAHIFTQMLIAFGLNTNCIKSLLDNDTNKIGKFLYGTNLLVNSPSILKKEQNPIVILRAAQYTDEICHCLSLHNDRAVII